MNTRLAIGVVLLVSASVPTNALPMEGKQEVIVEEVTKSSAGDLARLHEGDIVQSWVRDEARGEIQSPFDLSAIEIEQGPCGKVTLEGLRGMEKKSWTLGPGNWGIKARPLMSDSLLALYHQGQETAEAGKLAEAAENWKVAAGQAKDSAAIWFLFQRASMWMEAKRWDAADKAYQEALEAAGGARTAIRAQLFKSWGDAYRSRSDWDNAEACYQQYIAENQKLNGESLGIARGLNDLGAISYLRGDWAKAEEHYVRALVTRQKLAAGSLDVAASLNSLGAVSLSRGNLAGARDYFSQALEIRQRLVPASLVVASSLTNLGTVAWNQGDLVKAEEYYHQALDIQQKLVPDSRDVAASLSGLGNIALSRGDLARAGEYYSHALDIQGKLAPGSLDVGKSFAGLGLVAEGRGDLAKAEEYHLKALDIERKLVPGTLDVAKSFTNLGNVAWRRGDLEKAEEYHHKALDIEQKLAPGSLDVATSFINLGIVADERGDLEKAEEYHRKALDIEQKVTPGSLDVAASFTNLGIVADERGDLEKAEEYHRKALDIEQKLAPGSLSVAGSRNELGIVAWTRGDLAKAEDSFRDALEIQEKLAPGSLVVASILNNLGGVAKKRGNLVKAEEYFLQALDIRQKLAPGSLVVSESLDNLGVIAMERGDLVKAQEYDLRALDIQQKLAPGSMDTSASYTNLADVARDRKHLTKAEEYYRGALTIRAKLAPESKEYAESLASLAGVLRRNGQTDSAAQLYEQALNAFQSQIVHLGGTEETRSNFRADHSSYFIDYIDLLMSEKKPDLAFQVGERWRARSLLEMLVEARVDIRQGVDPELRARERLLQESLKAKSDRRIRLLAAEHTDQNRVAEVEEEISDLRNQYDELQGRIRATSPVYVALIQPQPLRVEETQQLLDDTLLLEFALGETRSYLWAVTSDSLTAYELPKRAEIEVLARSVYRLLTAPNRSTQGESGIQRQARLNKFEAAYWQKAAALSEMVLRPVAAQLHTKRLLIVSDGALQYIPFSALPIPGRRRRPLVADHEIVCLPSASVLKLLRQEELGRKPPAKMVAVLADPVFSSLDSRVRANEKLRKPRGREDKPGVEQRLTRSVRDVGWHYLPRLPFSRQEAEAIEEVTRPDQRFVALGFQASRLTATGPELGQYGIVHFATHSLLDDKHFERSGLVLSMVDEAGRPQNGFLDLQDIYNLTLPVELVVLSACRTGLGNEIRGEGLIGLTRGFMHAGATRVMASLWSTDDAATSELMKRFYKAMLVDGLGPAAALRKAQLQMWKHETWNHPYDWAAFTIQGEWKTPADIVTHH